MMVLSGSTFAARSRRAACPRHAITLARGRSRRAQGRAACRGGDLGSPTFRPYLSADLIGVQLGGAVKNVLAIACGMCEGRRLGANAKAALLTRGLAEIVRLAVAPRRQSRNAHGPFGPGRSGADGHLAPIAQLFAGRSRSAKAAPSTRSWAARRSVTEGVTTADGRRRPRRQAEGRDADLRGCRQRAQPRRAASTRRWRTLLERPLRDEVETLTLAVTAAQPCITAMEMAANNARCGMHNSETRVWV